MAWKFDAPAPVYLQIKWRIKNDILTGVYAADEQIPSVRQLAQTAAVNPNTMQRALQEMEAEGLLYSKGTSGRYVSGNAKEIERAKETEARKIIAEFFEKAESIGISKPELLRMIEEEHE